MEMKAPMTTAHPHPPSGGVYPTGPPTAGGILNEAGDDSVGAQRPAEDKILFQLSTGQVLAALPHRKSTPRGSNTSTRITSVRPGLVSTLASEGSLKSQAQITGGL